MKLLISFLWHMHQPYYKDPETGKYVLPWVRLHAIKDYVAIPRIFREFPKVRHTFNLVPSLLVQLRDYVENGAQDTFLDVSRRNALDLSRDEEEFLVRNFFAAFPPTMILPHPRYAALYHRREAALRAIGKPGAPGGFGASDYTDLATLFNLAWFHPLHREEDPELARLWRKESGFTEKDKSYVLDRQIGLMASVIPEYRRVVAQDGGELSTTPMYHPILPLLVDNGAALEAHPGAPLPKYPFSYPGDAAEQIRRGRETFTGLFGRVPAGLWPSEGSISPAVLEMAARAGFRWTATDEILLSKALQKPIRRDQEGIPLEPEVLYRPYQAMTPAGPIQLLFRDHRLSDLLGFEYSRWDSIHAADNFIHNIKQIYDRLSSLPSSSRQEAYLVPVILDGENAWEYFFDSGRIFLKTLMEKLGSLHPRVACVPFTEALESIHYVTPLPTIPTGSWIDGTFNIWIGHPEDIAAWEMLARARHLWQSRADQAKSPDSRGSRELAASLEHLFVAEGSDWCWWYGDDHFTPHGPEFDRLFRHQVKAAYRELGEEPPDYLDIPIIRPDRVPAARNFLASPTKYISPRIDGTLTSYFEWSAATVYRPSPEYGTMHRAGHGLMSSLHYGFNSTVLFLRIDFHPEALESGAPLTLEIFFTSKGLKAAFAIDPSSGGVRVLLEKIENGPSAPGEERIPDSRSRVQEVPDSSGIEAAFRKVFETGIPFRTIGCDGENRIEFFLTLSLQGEFGERWPMYGNLTAELPGKDFEERMWEV